MSSQPKAEFEVKDAGAKVTFASGMQRNVVEGKIDFHRAADGPMLRRWAAHLTKAKAIYPDVAPGVANWTLAAGDAELARYRESAFRHFMQWYYGEVDEDHASATFFNINGAEAVKEKMGKTSQEAPKKAAICLFAISGCNCNFCATSRRA